MGVALDADTKLAINYLVGLRSTECAESFIGDLASRLEDRIQLTTDGHGVYVNAIEKAFGGAVDYAMLVKVYGEGMGGMDQRRYSPSSFVKADKRRITGAPELSEVSTSYVERQNLTIRMQNRRFTRLTNAFSKKIENLEHSIALHFMHYNFARIHKTLRVTPAMEAGLSITFGASKKLRRSFLRRWPRSAARTRRKIQTETLPPVLQNCNFRRL